MKKIELIILSAKMANEFCPKKPTAVIRIWNSDPALNSDYDPRIAEFGYVKILNYTFDDITCWSADELDKLAKSDGWEEGFERYAYLSRDMATLIAEDFQKILPRIDCLMVHCRLGLSRSPAVAMALNEVFKLGTDTLELSRNFPRYNEVVYEMVVEAALKVQKDNAQR